MYNMGHDIIGYIRFPLKPVVIEIISAIKDPSAQVDEFIIRAKEEIALLPYSNELRLKIEQAILETFKKLETFRKHKFVIKERYNRFDFSVVFYQILRAKVDFIDLAFLLGIDLDKGTLSRSEIKEYQGRYFPIHGGSVDNLEEVTENDYHLYNTWYARFLENKAKGIYDISIPEAKAAFDYLEACVALYRKMFKEPIFQEYLKAKANSYYSDNSSENDTDNYTNLQVYIQDRLDRFEAINKESLEEASLNYSYFKLVEMDMLWRELLDAIFLNSSEIYQLHFNREGKDTSIASTSKLFEEGYFFLPGIGELNNTVFAVNYGVPYLHFYDITISMVTFDGSPYPTLINRRQHDNNHVLRMKNDYEKLKIRNYYQHQNRKWIKIAFIRFLEFCKKISHEEYIATVPVMVRLIHESTAQYFPIFPNFMSVLIREQSDENIERFKLTSESIGELNQAWRKVWEHLPLKIEEK